MRGTDAGLCEKAALLLAALDAGLPPRTVLAVMLEWGLMNAGTSVGGRRRLPHRVELPQRSGNRSARASAWRKLTGAA